MKVTSFIALSAFVANAAFAGQITNGDFATGNLSGWTTYGPVSVTNNGANNVAVLGAGMGANVYTTLSQTVHLNAGDTLTGSAQFFAADYLPFNDDSYVSIDLTKLFTASVGSVGNYGSSPLTNFTFTAATAGDYLVQAGVANRGDNSQSSQLWVSNFAVTSADVPEPASLALLGLGALGLAAARRKTSKTA